MTRVKVKTPRLMIRIDRVKFRLKLITADQLKRDRHSIKRESSHSGNFGNCLVTLETNYKLHNF